MEQIPSKQLNRLERLLNDESQIPFTNRLLDDETAETFSSSWLNKSWSNLLHADLVEAGEQLHYRRLLRSACKQQLPKLRQDLEDNEYQALIMDLVDQEYDELETHGSMNALYLLEMACELSRLEAGRPAYMELLNMIKLHRLEYGTLDNLRQKVSETGRSRDRYLYGLEQGEAQLQADSNSDISAEVQHFKKSVSDNIDLVTGFNFFQPDSEAEEHIHDEVIRLWKRFEDRVISNISNLLNNSDYMRKIKKYLWGRQEQYETAFDDAIGECDDPEVVDEFRKALILKRPRIRNGMGTKISATPEIAEKVYGILDCLINTDISALKFLEVFEALASTRFEGAICEVQLAFERVPDLASHPDQLTLLLSSFEDRYQDLSSKEKYELSRRHYSPFSPA